MFNIYCKMLFNSYLGTYKKDAIAIKAPFAAHEHAQSLKLFLQLLLLPDELFDTLSRFQLKLQYCAIFK